METLKMHSLDGVQRNIDLIGKLFPNAITEVKRNGKVEHAIDFDVLRQELSDSIVEGREERYQFTWPDKKKAMLAANAPITATLRPVVADSVGKDGTPGGFDSENLYIEGDNLEVLKLLQESYLGKVKMIYIDPPYNTGNDFIYADDFMRSQEEENEQMGMFDEDENHLFKNTDANGRFHSDWCSMIYSRLMLARNLLSDDGIVMVSIDEHEHSNLLSIMNEIFGESNYVDSIVWDKKSSAKGVPPRNMMVNVHEYIVAYQKSISFRFVGEKRDEEADGFKNPDNDPRGPWRESNIKSTTKPIEDAFTIVDPNTGKEYTNTWAFSRESLERMIQENRILWKDSLPKQKEFMSEMTNENKAIKSNWGVFDAQSTTVFLKHLIPEMKFDNPKPINLMKYLIRVSMGSDGVILDLFSGSATTSEAVMRVNEEDGGKRKYIAVQIQEKIDSETETYKAGYKNICEIGKERIRRAGDKIKSESPLTTQDLDIGFRVLKLDDTNMKDVYYAADDYSQDMIAGLESNIKDDRTDLDLLFGCLIDWGLPLSLPYRSEQIDGCTVHTYNGGDLIACFDANIPESVVKTIVKRKPLRAVFRDSGFASSPEKINVFEIFKLYMPEDAGDITKRVRVI